MYSMACNRVTRFSRLATLMLPATAPIAGSSKCRTQARSALALSLLSASMFSTSEPRACASPRLSAEDLPPLALRITRTRD